MIQIWPCKPWFFSKNGWLGGGNSKIFYFHPKPWGNDPIWRAYFSIGLIQPPPRWRICSKKTRHYRVLPGKFRQRQGWYSSNFRAIRELVQEIFVISVWRVAFDFVQPELFFACLLGWLIGWLVCWLVDWFAGLLVCLFACLLVCLLVCLFVCLFVR